MTKNPFGPERPNSACTTSRECASTLMELALTALYGGDARRQSSEQNAAICRFELTDAGFSNASKPRVEEFPGADVCPPDILRTNPGTTFLGLHYTNLLESGDRRGCQELF
eukprot:CAMPEP_0170615042 /NCGR_PEP_ID=MMETSP0224-20130122/25123_1 /TAXON_ID=285029 /ORGANISM="Togula jolla, Strain CCCM 725" /LENGTH=110 /DNA_ID=CAMNT_0010940741 /DNA_START=142 /DNA_END=475 /DNA_ORIENTATION=+